MAFSNPQHAKYFDLCLKAEKKSGTSFTSSIKVFKNKSGTHSSPISVGKSPESFIPGQGWHPQSCPEDCAYGNQPFGIKKIPFLYS